MSSDDPVVDVRDLGKRYEIYSAPRDRLKQMLLPPLARALSRPEPRYFREFWALRDISFQVRRGETLAIIGRNGSGKSTLLQIIAGTMAPTTGDARTHGRIAALLELGSGFNPEFTGRENVYLNCAILGLTREQVDARLDEILAFADIGAFVDQPVKTYSSGMMVRLAFAVQAHIAADIVIIDEALAVGDVFFAQKCFARLRTLVDSGAAVIFVTHDMSTVTQFCRSAIVLHEGRQLFQGDPVAAIRRYMLIGREESSFSRGSSGPADEPPEATVAGDWPPPDALVRAPEVDVVEGGRAEFLGCTVRDALGRPANLFEMGDIAEFFYDFLVKDDIGIPVGGISIVNDKNIIVHGKNSLQVERGPRGPVGAGTRLRFRQRIALRLTPGEYTAVIGLAATDATTYANIDVLPHDDLTARTERISSVGRACTFGVVLRRKGVALTHHGLCDLDGDIAMKAHRPDPGGERTHDRG
ncbi:ABC transporter ATP-binding protein [Usitatibacter palustris]|uniref:Vitamin B12 import ATP-binding protein BtuD n=1 Tax=Usitatibacter palustris TaxID=2732487 RepID=A0A6M4HCN0_9PROT|nr:ABC transporter ATP-binding protein [Usitatibacter palustris]QJR16488.1 Vitamin B12 import ATP-binding protein BtuD [Usitatibacter palustris]